MPLRIKDLDGLIGEIISQLSMLEDEMVLVSEEETTKVYRDKGCIYVKELGIDIYDAYVYTFEPETNDFEIDCDLCLFYLHSTDKQIYSEGGSSLPVCINNYLHFSGSTKSYTMEEILNLEFEYILNGQSRDILSDNNK